MKKIILYLFVLSLTITGCSLDEHPYSITADNLAEDKNGPNQLVTSIYSVFWESSIMVKTYFEWLDMDHDHATAHSWVVSGAGNGNVTTHWGYNNSNDLWNAFYLMINRANVAAESILKVDGFESSASLKQSYGEVLFLRAFAYFHIVRMYGPCPIRLAVLTPTDMARSSIKTVYDVIVKDLENAILYMDYPSSGFVGSWGHADRTAAEILLARVYATMGSGKLASNSASMNVDVNGNGVQSFTMDAVAGYEEFDSEACYRRVRDLMTNVISRKGIDFDLKESFINIWGSNNKRNNEFVWGVASFALFETSHLHYYYTSVPYGGSQWAGMTEGLYKQYEEQDNRATEGVFHYLQFSYTSKYWYRFPAGSDYNTPPNGGTCSDVTSGSYYYGLPQSTKWYNGEIDNPVIKPYKDATQTVQDVILIRFAEAYLLLAEAENELNNPFGSRDALNVIRRRADASEVTLSDKVELRSAIYQERSLELALEFNRKFDLLRWGLYLKVMNATGNVQTIIKSKTISKIREPRSVLFAVPTAEITSNKLFGGNNKGW